MQAVKQLAELSARGPEESTLSAAPTTSIQPKAAEGDQASSSVDMAEPKSESKPEPEAQAEPQRKPVSVLAALRFDSKIVASPQVVALAPSKNSQVGRRTQPHPYALRAKCRSNDRSDDLRLSSRLGLLHLRLHMQTHS